MIRQAWDAIVVFVLIKDYRFVVKTKTPEITVFANSYLVLQTRNHSFDTISISSMIHYCNFRYLREGLISLVVLRKSALSTTVTTVIEMTATTSARNNET